MNEILTFLWNLLSQAMITLGTTLAHNWLVLSLSILTAVALKTYVNTEKLRAALLKRKTVSIFASVLFGSFTPFCACGTTAVIIGMLSTALPWGPVMAFLTSSPLMSPDGFIMMSGVLGLRFAIALTAASIGIGLGAGFLTEYIEKKTAFLQNQLRHVQQPAQCGCSAVDEPASLSAESEEKMKQRDSSKQHEKNHHRWHQFYKKYKMQELGKTFVRLGLRQILLNFSIFIVVGFLINYFVPESIISVLFGAQSATAVPLASIIGLPLYVTTESAIPIIQSILKSGGSEGAMLAFVITGSATSAWVIAGLSTFLKKKAIGLYVLFILAGGILSGYLYDFVLTIM